MKYIQRTKNIITQNFLENILIEREVLPNQDIDRMAFYKPSWNNLLDYQLLDNIETAADMIEHHIKLSNKIYIVVDCD